MGFLIPPHPLTNFEIQKYKNEPRFNGIFSRNSLPKKIKDGAYVINLHEYADVDYTNLFSPHDFRKNDNIILSYFKKE